MLRLDYFDRRFVRIPITIDVDPTADVVEFSFALPGSDTLEWLTAEWDPDRPKTARLMVEPTTMGLARGSYLLRARITDNPERPVLRSGSVTIV